MLRQLTTTQRTVDLLIAGAYFLVFGLLGLHTSTVFGPLPIVAALAFAVALALRRWAPGLALGAAWLGAVAQMVSGDDANLLDAAIPPILYACAAYGTKAIRWAAFSSAFVGALIAGAFTARSSFATAISSGEAADWQSALSSFGIVGALTAVTLLLAWTLGILVRTARRSRVNRQEADEAGQQVAAEQERTRIARDMHDVVAHSLAVVIAQSDGARLLRRTDPEAVDEALETIGSVSRAALADVRVLLQQLRYEGTTSVQPGLADLDALVDQFRGSGLQVELRREGDLTALGTASQLAAFRIVQESLTNALRHADRDRPASVLLARTPHGLEIEVLSGIDPDRPPRLSSTGHGLIGMRERAAAVQGDLRAGPDGDRFRVSAFLPVAGTGSITLPDGMVLR